MNIISNVFDFSQYQLNHRSDSDVVLKPIEIRHHPANNYFVSNPKVSLEELLMKIVEEQESNSRPRPVPPKPRNPAPENIIWFEASLTKAY
jgi:hypothetical protein